MPGDVCRKPGAYLVKGPTPVGNLANRYRSLNLMRKLAYFLMGCQVSLRTVITWWFATSELNCKRRLALTMIVSVRDPFQ